MKKLLSVAAAAVLAVAVMFFAFSYDDDGSGVPASSTQDQPASPRSYVVSTVAGCCGRRATSPEELEAFFRAQADATDGPGATAGFRDLRGIALGPDGSLYVADWFDNKIRKITADGTVSTIAGKGYDRGGGHDDGDCASATFHQPEGIAVDKAGNVYVADGENNAIRKISMSATGCEVSTLAGSGTSGHADGTGKAASFYAPSGLAVDAAGNLYVADFKYTIRKVTPDGVVTTIADGTSGGLTEGATSISALIRRPARLRAALYKRIFGDAWSLTAGFYMIQGIAVDAAGNVYVSGLEDIRKITPDGWVSKLAGSDKCKKTDGVGSKAAFCSPEGLAVDAGGNLYVADHLNYAVRKISPAGEVVAIAGAGNYDLTLAAFEAEPSPHHRDGPAEKATLFLPTGVVVDGNGVIYVADHDRIRKITPEP